jgi:hypothetical protein
MSPKSFGASLAGRGSGFGSAAAAPRRAFTKRLVANAKNELALLALFAGTKTVSIRCGNQ